MLVVIAGGAVWYARDAGAAAADDRRSCVAPPPASRPPPALAAAPKPTPPSAPAVAVVVAPPPSLSRPAHAEKHHGARRARRRRRRRRRAAAAPPATRAGSGAAAVGPAHLTLTADVQADAYIDGQYIRATPIVDYELPPGKHTIHLEIGGARIALDPARSYRRAQARRAQRDPHGAQMTTRNTTDDPKQTRAMSEGERPLVRHAERFRLAAAGGASRSRAPARSCASAARTATRCA